MSLTGDRYVGTCGGHTIEERAKGTQLISMMSCVIAILYIRHDDDAVRRSQPLEEAQPRGHATASAKVIEATTINS